MFRNRHSIPWVRGGVAMNRKSLGSRLRPVRRYEAGHDYGYKKYSGHGFKCTDETKVGIHWANAAIADAGDGHHAEVQERPALVLRYEQVERCVEHSVEDPIELRKRCGDHQVADESFGNRAARDLRHGVEVIENRPQDRTREDEASDWRQLRVEMLAVAERFESPGNGPDGGGRKNGEADNFRVSRIGDACEQSAEHEYSKKGSSVRVEVRERRCQHFGN